MNRNHIRVLYVEILLLGAICAIYIVLRSYSLHTAPSPCGESNYWVPYTFFHAAEVCANKMVMILITIYYISSLLIISSAQYGYLRGRTRLHIISRPRFAGVLFVVMFTLAAWVVGRSSTNSLFDFRVHESGALGIFIIPITIPSFQFILSILMLEEKGRVDYA